MNRWADKLPVVAVPRTQRKPVTLVLPFYENHAFLEQQIAQWAAYDDGTKRQVHVIVVDDGSPTPARLPSDPPVAMRLFRIDVDVRWNWLAARNIGAHHAADGWVLFTDMDHVVPAETMRAVVSGAHDPRVVYAFSRHEHTGTVIPPHSASFLMTRAMFWRIGGYDEALSGFYGTDGDFRRRVAPMAPMQVLRESLVRYEYVGDSSTRRYLRKQPEDARVQALIAARSSSWQPRVLSFDYHEVCA